MGLVKIEKKILVTAALSLGLVTTIGFAVTPNGSGNIQRVALGSDSPLASPSALMDNPRADNYQTTGSEGVLLYSASTSNSNLATVGRPAKNAPTANKQSNSKSIPENIPQSWLEQVQKDIAQREYHITWQDKTDLPNNKPAWQAPNRAHDFRTYFTEQGLTVVPRSGTKDWLWSLKLIAYGDEQTSNTTKPEVKDNKITFQHSAKLKEWYINNEQGLEQGFTLNAPANSNEANKSQATKNNNTLKLSFQLGGSLTATLTNNNQTISLKDKNKQQRFTFGELKVIDANNKTLKSFFELNQQTQVLTLVTDTSNAVYPITVDPVLSGASRFLESNQANAQFGFSVASAGDVNGDGFGDVIIGAPNYSNGQNNEGAVFVYYGSTAGLNTSLFWRVEGNQANAFFGWSVASAGNVNGDVNTTTGLPIDDVIIGAYGYNSGGQGFEGAVFVYHGSSTGLDPSETPWIAEGNQAGAQFGLSVASAGDVNGDGYGDVIIGAYLYDNVEINEGAAFVYLGSNSGLTTTINIDVGPSPVADWSAKSNQLDAQFGNSVASAGDVNGDGYGDVIIGARFYDNGQTDEGAAFVYLGSSMGLTKTVNSGTGPSPVADWATESNQADAWFGWSVASAGNVNGDSYGDVIVGAVLYDNGETDEGAAFVYLGSSTGLTTTVNSGAGPSPVADWITESNQADAQLGYSVASAGDINSDGFGDVIVGANFFDNNESFEGAIFIYLGSSTGPSTSVDWTAESNQVDAKFGTSVASAGDVNGDGFSDIIIGANTYDNGQANEGAVFLYLGSSLGFRPTPYWTAEGNQTSAKFGFSVASAGDVNGDGFADVVLGAPDYDKGQTDEGVVFVFLGSGTGLNPASNWTAESNQAFSQFGYSVASAGDVNGDGFGDIIVGAPVYDKGQPDEGAVFVYLGSSAGLNVAADWIADGNQGGGFGISVSSAGDVNGDGYGDIIIGETGYSNGEIGEGAAFVYLGSGSGLTTTLNTGAGPNPIADWTSESNQSRSVFGGTVASAGDVNGDGYGDVIIGAPLYENGQTGEGAAFVYMGSSTGLTTTLNAGTGPNPIADWFTEGNQTNIVLGDSVASAGDINGDGFGDVIVGVIGYDNALGNVGAAFVYHGSVSGLSASFDWSAESNQVNASFGSSVASAGDVNGDGYGDVIIGAPNYTNVKSFDGSAFVYQGSRSGLTTTLNTDIGPSPIADWTVKGSQMFAKIGSSIAGLGDVDSDGYGDVMIGAYLYNNGEIDEGAVGIYDLTPPLAPFTQSGSYNITQHLIAPRIGSSSTLIPACGLSDRRDSFKLQVIRNNAAPIATLQLEWEVKANGVAFDGVTTPGFVTNASASGSATITETVNGLQPNTAYRWRARVLENGVAGPWLRVLNHDVQGCDVRTNTESDLALSITGPAAVADQHDFNVVFTIDNNVSPANGPDQAQEVKLEISNIPSAYLYKTASSNNGSTSCSPTPPPPAGFRTEACIVTSINPGTATTITLTYQATAQVNGSLVGTVSLKNYDPILTNNTATYDIVVTPPVGVTLSPKTDFLSNENKLMDYRSVVLNGPPDGTVTIVIGSSNANEGSVSPTLMTFTKTDWNIPKPVSVHGALEDPSNVDGGDGPYIITLTPSSTDALDNSQISGVIAVNGINQSTTVAQQALALAIPHAQSPGYDAKNIPKENVSLRWKKVISPRDMPVTYIVKICKDDVTLSGGCVTVPALTSALTSANTDFSPMFYASFGGSSLLFLGLMNTRIRRRWVLVLVTVAVASTLVSCGGGGGSDLPPSAPPEANTMGTTVSLAAGTWYWQVVASDGGTPVASEVMIFTVQ